MRLATILAALSWSTSVWAQGAVPSQPRAEIVAAWSIGLPVSGGMLEATYAPPLRLGGAPIESRSSQALAVDVGVAQGLDLGANIFFGRVFGLQVAFAWSRANLSGSNPGYDVFLRYVAMPPPDYVPREFTYEQSSSWEATSGTLRQAALSVGGVARWGGASSRVGGALAAGLSATHTSGEIMSLAYTQFILGGHSTLFPVTHRVVMVPAQGQWAWRPYVGGDVHVRVAGHLAVFGGVRVVLGSSTIILTTPERLVDPGENPWAPELSDLRDGLTGQPLELPGTRWRVLVGAKVLVG